MGHLKGSGTLGDEDLPGEDALSGEEGLAADSAMPDGAAQPAADAEGAEGTGDAWMREDDNIWGVPADDIGPVID